MKNNAHFIRLIARMLVLVLVSACGKSNGEDFGKDKPYKRALLECREGASEKDISNAKKTLNADDSQVVLELSECLELHIPAARQFQSYKTLKEDEEEKKTLAYVAFIVLKRKLECLATGVYHAVQVLDEGNVKAWIDARKNLTLREMQLAVAKEGLNKAKESYKINNDPYCLRSIKEYQANVDAILSGHPPHWSLLVE